MLRRDFDESLKQLLIFCGFQTSSFKGHSFRIGAAMDAQIRAASRSTVTDMFRTKFPMKSSRAQTITDSIAKFIASDMQP